MLRRYQHDIMNHIVLNPRCAVWASMGSGKTLATLMAIDMLMITEDAWPVLIVAPLRVAKTVWPVEAKKWPITEHMPIQFIHGTEAQRDKQLMNTNKPIHVINFEMLPWLANYFKSRWPYRMVVVDESSRLKGFRSVNGSKRAKALARKAFVTRRFVLLTGTPAPNGLEDLWGQYFFMDQGLRLGHTILSYRSRWFNPKPLGIGKGFTKWVPKKHALAEVTHTLSDITIRVDVKDYLDIKEPIVNKVMTELPPKAKRLYKDMERDMFVELETADVEAFSAGVKTGKCLQLASGAIYTENKAYEVVHDAKLDALESIVEESAGQPLLVAYHFKHDLERIQKAFPKAVALDTDPATIERWNKGEIPMLLVHPASAGHGLNLAEGGNTLVFFSVDWNLEYHLQVIERIGPTRQAQLGNDRAVFLHYILAKDTLDEAVFERLTTKKTLQEIIIELLAKRRTKK